VGSPGLRGRGAPDFSTGTKVESLQGMPGRAQGRDLAMPMKEIRALTWIATILEAIPIRSLKAWLSAPMAIGSSEGIIYVRAEYLWRFQGPQQAMQDAAGLGFRE